MTGGIVENGKVMGTAAVEGKLWGAKAHIWAEAQEPAWRPVFDRVLTLSNVGAGTRYLDIGCGAGGALTVAAERRALVSGLDASEALVGIARRRLPDADIVVGDMEKLPFPDDTYNVVSGINAFQFAGDTVTALKEAGRVCHPNGIVIALVWGEREYCQLMRVTQAALSPLLPPSGPPARPLGTNGQLEEAMRAAGMVPNNGGSFDTALIYPTLETAVTALSSSGLANRAEAHAGAETVGNALEAALRPFVQPEGSVSLDNRFVWATAAPGL